MNRAGIQRLKEIADRACDPARRPLSPRERMRLLAELYAPPPKDDLFADQAKQVDPLDDTERA